MIHLQNGTTGWPWQSSGITPPIIHPWGALLSKLYMGKSHIWDNSLDPQRMLLLTPNSAYKTGKLMQNTCNCIFRELSKNAKEMLISTYP